MIQKFVILLGILVFILFSRSIAGEISLAMNFQSGAIVLGGALISVFLSFPLKTFRGLWRSLRTASRHQEPDLDDLVRQAKTLARVRRLYGPRELSSAAARVGNPFLRKGIELVLDDYDRFEIHAIMEKEYELYLSRKEAEIGILNTLSRLAPAFGFVGTIIGLISVLSHMGDPAEIGHGMALALLTTFYGLVLSNLVFQPLSRKLTEHLRDDAVQHSIVMEAVLDIADAKNPLAMSHRLHSYIRLGEEEESSVASTARTGGLKPILRRMAVKR